MKMYFIFLSVIVPVSLFLGGAVNHPESSASFAPVQTDTVSGKGLFESDELLEITLKGDMRDLLNDRTGDPKLFPITLSYLKGDSSEVSIPVKAKTRGHFRRLRENCKLPPLLIQFSKKGPQENTLFSEQHKLKLVMPCSGDEYIIHEWLAYKMYNLVTPYSFRARLVKVKIEDDRNKKPMDPFYGILLEEEKQMAKRNNAVIVEKKLRPQQIKTDYFFKMAVFQYFVGNTDWSIQYQQNIKLVSPASGDSIIAVPYDFDHSGLVNAPYAHPAEELQMNSVRQRRFRGYCVPDMNTYNDVLAEYNRLKDGFYSLLNGCTMVDHKYLKSTGQWMDDFFKTINNPKEWHKDFSYPCDKYGTGNVIIKGLKED